MRLPRALVWTAVLACVAAAAGARAERYAVLAVDTDHDGAETALASASAMRKVLVARKLEILDGDATRSLFHQQLDIGGTSVAKYKEQLTSADQALASLNQEAALKILKSVVNGLATDPDPSVEKQALLEPARLKLASRLLAIAGPKESGNAETEQGREARAILVDALRANPKLAPGTDEYPPRFITLVAGARSELQSRPTGMLSVKSKPDHATVFLDGREMGSTPLDLGTGAALVAGNYRVWVELNGARSVPKQITIGANPAPITIDLAFEGALWEDGPGLRPVSGAIIDEEVARKIAGLLQVDTLLLTGKSHYDDSGTVKDNLWAEAFRVRDMAIIRGSMDLVDGLSVDAAAQNLAGFLLGFGDAQGVQGGPTPPSVLPEKHKAGGNILIAGGDPQQPPNAGEFPWVTVGIAGGAVAVAAIIGVTVAAVVIAGNKEGQAVITVEDLR